MQKRSPFWERWPTPIWFCILFPVLNFTSHECFPNIKFWKALSDGANMILLWAKKERVDFFPCLSSLAFYHLPGHPVHIQCRGMQCVPIWRGNHIEYELKWIELNQIHSSYLSIDGGRVNLINKHLTHRRSLHQVYDRGNLNDHIQTSDSEDGDLWKSQFK